MTSGIVRGRHLFGISWCSTWSSIHALASFLSHRARKRGGRSLRRRHRRRGRRILRVAAIKRMNPAQVLPIARRQSARPIHLHEILVVVTALDHHPSPIPTEGKTTMLILDPANIPNYKRRQGLCFGLQRLDLFFKPGAQGLFSSAPQISPHGSNRIFSEEGRAGVERQCVLQWPTENYFRG